MNPSVLIPGIVGAICGALGWLLVGLYMARRQYARTAKNAGRAVIVAAYVSHVGYGQANEDRQLPDDVRHQALSGILGTQVRAIALLRGRVFTEEQAQRMGRSLRGDATDPADPADDDRAKKGANDAG